MPSDPSANELRIPPIAPSRGAPPSFLYICLRAAILFGSLLVLCAPTQSLAVTEWSWIAGAKTANAPGVYTAPGGPGARSYASSAVDGNGDLWLFGGNGYGAVVSPPSPGHLNDLWRYDASGWQLVSGSGTRNSTGTYVAIGSAGTPCARRGAAMWFDGSGDLWLFGGYGYGAASPPFQGPGPLNDLWKFSAGTWTWMGGSEFVGDPGTAGHPSARSRVSFHHGTGDTVWFFGGEGIQWDGIGTSPRYYGDLWSFDGSTWALRSGVASHGSWGWYGDLGIPLSDTHPGGRAGGIMTTCPEGGLWLFGGWGWDAGATVSRMNDLWRFDGALWTWVSGSQFAGDDGNFGILGLPSPNNRPRARADAAGWTDASGNLWVFGGTGNDLWMFDGGWWTWVGGSTSTTAFGTYGAMGIPSPDNTPGSRVGPASWYSSAIGPRLFGGSGQAEAGGGFLNDLWAVILDPPVRTGLRPYVQWVLAPAPDDTVYYQQRLRWHGGDIDGTVSQYLYAVDPGPGDTLWIATPYTSLYIFLAADTLVEPVPADGPILFARPHTIVIKAIDNDGLESNREIRNFVASTIAPETHLISPIPDPLRAVTSIDLEFKWDGVDADGYFTVRPVHYKWCVYSYDVIAFARMYPDSFRRLVAPEFSGWSSTSAETTSVRLNGLTPGRDYFFCVVGFDEAGAYSARFGTDWNLIWFRVPQWLAADREPVTEMALQRPAPNPARHESTLGFALSREGPVSLEIFDTGGRRMRTLVRGTLPAGLHTATWDLDDANGRPVPAGLYFLRLEAGPEVRAQRLVVAP